MLKRKQFQISSCAAKKLSLKSMTLVWDVLPDRGAPSVSFVVVWNSVCSLWEGRPPTSARNPRDKTMGAQALVLQAPPLPSPSLSCFPKQWSGMCRAGAAWPSAPVTVPGWPFTPELSRLLLLSSKMFQYVELWGRDGEKNRDIVEKEIMNNPAASLHTPHVGRSG